VEVNDQRYFSTAFGNLDGRPGDEIVLAIDNFGLVALGRKDPAQVPSPVSSRHSAR
jgi:hypothetical protein